MKNFFKFAKIKEEHRTNKTFNYEKNGVSLNFTLRVDVKNELEIFKELLEKAIQEVEKEINK